MIRADMIPDEVVEAAAIALHARWVIICVQDGGDPLDYERWEGLEDDEKQGWRQEARAALVAGLNAWPEGESILHAIIAWALAEGICE